MADISTSDLEALAGWLTGKRVTVRRRSPARAGAIGQACKSESGAYFIDLDSGLTGWALAETALHEIAHIRLNHVTTPSPYAHAAPASLPLYQGVHSGNRAAYKAREAEADNLAAEWLRWLRAHGGELESLQFWPIDISEIAAQAARRVLTNLRR